ncbi:MAG: heavy-metal-associated domain-containing protein [Candidatus Kerfeldbacteria bacterium]|nr:heavy-metal-associated domain-containing protein [Candidatus Kerfeldbacteria bacterium]
MMTTITLNILGMHCTSCSMNIDDALEELPGVEASKTSYARATTEVTYDPAQVSQEKIAQTIQDVGYQVA